VVPTQHLDTMARFGVYLERKGFKNTPERRAIAREVLAIEEHFDPELLQTRLRRRGSASRAPRSTAPSST